MPNSQKYPTRSTHKHGIVSHFKITASDADIPLRSLMLPLQQNVFSSLHSPETHDRGNPQLCSPALFNLWQMTYFPRPSPVPSHLISASLINAGASLTNCTENDIKDEKRVQRDQKTAGMSEMWAVLVGFIIAGSLYGSAASADRSSGQDRFSPLGTVSPADYRAGIVHHFCFVLHYERAFSSVPSC
jgi:hypothetical protein